MSRYLPLSVMQAPGRRAGDAEALPQLEHDIATHLSDFGPHIRQSRMVVYPEIHLSAISGTPEERAAILQAAAEPLNGPRMKALADIARRQKVWLLPGTVCERGEDGHLYATAPVFSPAGELVAAYRKCFPWRPFEPYQPGNQCVVFDIPGVARVGLAICYDIWFPEIARQLAWMGAEVIINQAATSTCDREQEKVLVRANAIMNQVYVVSANAAAPDGVGQSRIIDPEGRERVVAADAGATVLTDVLNIDEVSRVRHFGTAGLNRLWHQHREGDPVLALPVYGGVMPTALKDET